MHNFALSPVIIKVNRAECRSKEHLEQVSSVLLMGERLRGVNVLHCLGIRNHKVLLLRNQVINCNRSQLEIMYSEEAMNFEHLSIFLLPLEVRFASFFEVEIRKVSKEWVALLRTGNI